MKDSEAAPAMFAGIAVCVLAALAYLLPAVVARLRGHRNAVPLFVLNLFLGWTLLGWVGCLAWALAAHEPARYRRPGGLR